MLILTHCFTKFLVDREGKKALERPVAHMEEERYIADALLECATYRGCFDAEFYALAEDLQEKYPGLPFTVEVSGDWYNSTYQRVQLGDEMSVTVRFTVTINGFGSFLKITLPATRTGASENYWKTDS